MTLDKTIRIDYIIDITKNFHPNTEVHSMNTVNVKLSATHDFQPQTINGIECDGIVNGRPVTIRRNRFGGVVPAIGSSLPTTYGTARVVGYVDGAVKVAVTEFDEDYAFETHNIENPDILTAEECVERLSECANRGEFFELPDEITGFFGFRQVKVDPVKAMGFKLAGYQKGIREARSLFTGGEESVLKGGPKTANDVIRRFIAANKAKFLVQKELRKDIMAAETLGVDDFELRREFNERQLTRDYNRLNNDVFDPYVPSENIRREFRQIEERTGVPNPYDEALLDINDIVQDLRNLSFDDNFEDVINISDYIIDEGELISQAPLPTQPMPSPTVIQTAQNQALGGMNQGLTPIENALLSEEEKQIRLRQRGLA